ncbi:MAG: HlyD family type I secretion periplasmic adaptor subunit [Pseudomonadota bacterium]
MVDKLQLGQIGTAGGGALQAAPNRMGGVSLDPAETVREARRLWRGPLILGTATLFIFIGVFAAWASMANLASGAVAPGLVSPDSSRKTVQHLEGGIIRTLHVREGDIVDEGDPLVTLEPTQAEATFDARREQWLRLLVIRARLEAHEQGKDFLTFPDEVLASTDISLNQFIGTQTELFQVRRTSLEQEQAILGRQIEQLKDEIQSIEAENNGLRVQLSLIEEEIADKAQLFEKQLMRKSEMLALQRSEAGLTGNIASNDARVSRAQQRIEEIRLAVLQSAEQFRDRVAEEQTGVNNEIAQLEEAMISTRDVLMRTQITSPVSGTVLNMQYKTVGGVVRGGEPILDIVPLGDDLIISARLSPQDIDVVYPGLPARVQLVPFSLRDVQPLNGEVSRVAADSTVDEATGERFFDVRVTVSAEEVAANDSLFLSPGMPAEVIIVTGERTMADYLLEPMLHSFRVAFLD